MMLPCSSKVGMLKIWKAFHPGLSFTREETKTITKEEKDMKKIYKEGKK